MVVDGRGSKLEKCKQLDCFSPKFDVVIVDDLRLGTIGETSHAAGRYIIIGDLALGLTVYLNLLSDYLSLRLFLEGSLGVIWRKLVHLSCLLADQEGPTIALFVHGDEVRQDLALQCLVFRVKLVVRLIKDAVTRRVCAKTI